MRRVEGGGAGTLRRFWWLRNCFVCPSVCTYVCLLSSLIRPDPTFPTSSSSVLCAAALQSRGERSIQSLEFQKGVFSIVHWTDGVAAPTWSALCATWNFRTREGSKTASPLFRLDETIWKHPPNPLQYFTANTFRMQLVSPGFTLSVWKMHEPARVSAWRKMREPLVC